MPLGGLDPSMLIGFLCRDGANWWDFRMRSLFFSLLGVWIEMRFFLAIFSVQDEPPTWCTSIFSRVGGPTRQQKGLDLDSDGSERWRRVGKGDEPSCIPYCKRRDGKSRQGKHTRRRTQRQLFDAETDTPETIQEDRCALAYYLEFCNNLNRTKKPVG
jgi:hypothetical protein